MMMMIDNNSDNNNNNDKINGIMKNFTQLSIINNKIFFIINHVTTTQMFLYQALNSLRQVAINYLHIFTLFFNSLFTKPFLFTYTN